MRRCCLARLRRPDTESSVTPPDPALSGPTATGIGVADAGSGWMAAGCARRIAAPSGSPVPGAKTTASGASSADTGDSAGLTGESACPTLVGQALSPVNRVLFTGFKGAVSYRPN